MNVGQGGATSLSAVAYHDPEAYTLERRLVFAREWLLVGHEEDLRRTGDYIAGTLVGWPYLVLRDAGGELRAFHNVCRHRAGPLVEDGQGSCKALRCHYHGWTYGLDGRLKQRPGFMDGEDGFDAAAVGLFPMRASSWRGFVFVNLDAAAEPLEQGLGDLVPALARIPLERYRAHRRKAYSLAFNWKTYTDNYLEGYHIPFMHKGLAQDLDMASYRVENGERVCVHRSGTRSGGAYEGLFMWRWPNNTLGVYGGGLNICRILPSGPRSMDLLFDFYFDPEAALGDTDKDRACETTCSVVEEDFPMCGMVQRNLEAGIYCAGPLSPRHEQGLAYFHALIRERLEQSSHAL